MYFHGNYHGNKILLFKEKKENTDFLECDTKHYTISHILLEYSLLTELIPI